MKILAVILAALVIGTSSLYAATTIRDNCGCGIGTLALGDNPPTVLCQLAVTFLNGICANQTFGISSGTLGCEPHSGFASNSRIQEFVADNMDSLAADIAVGQGSTLDALADLMIVPAEKRADLFVTLQSHFDSIFTSSDVRSTDVVQNIAKIAKI